MTLDVACRSVWNQLAGARAYVINVFNNRVSFAYDKAMRGPEDVRRTG